MPNNTSLFFTKLTIHVAVCALLICCSQTTADDSHPIVPGFERFVDVEEITDVERGMLLINELNCLACHDAETAWPAKPKQAPVLSEIGSRVMPEYFESFLLDPHGTKPGTMMPDLLANKSEAESKEMAEALAHFLASTGTSQIQNASSSFVTQGQILYHNVGCVACHDPQGEDESKTISTSVPLGDLDQKYTLAGLTNFLKNPLHARPSGRMPKFNLAGREAQQIASFLLRNTVVDSRINFAYFEGTWEDLPRFDQLKPTARGTASGFDVHVGPKKDRFGIVFSGFWGTNKEAEYKFRLGSDDGSRLIIDGKWVVNNNGIHGMVFKEKVQTIPAGIHKVEVQFFEKDGGEELKVEVTGGGLDRVPLESLLRATRELPKEDAEKKPFELDQEKAAYGKRIFTSVGCANCHEMKPGGEAISTVMPSSKALNDLKESGGCFEGKGKSPVFGLTDFQVNCIKKAMAELRGLDSKTSLDQTTHEHLLTLNCYACHDRVRPGNFIVGGVIDRTGEGFEVFGRKDWFTGTQVEMGDEGQHPPSLTMIGSKLNPEWMDKVLSEGIKSRPYMNTRMPMFGKENIGSLADILREADALTDVPKIVHTEPMSAIKKQGRFFAGEDALSCIKCHTFGKHKATGVQSIDMTTMTKRLNKDWFQAYMLKPSRFRKGTRMPESWPEGKTFYDDILDGDTQKQIDAVWQFLSDGEDAAKPKGLVRAKNELKAVAEPVIYRNFIEGAGPRAIGVGYPEQINLAFDAQDCRMALIWKENFIDASRHWTGRGQGFEAPLGEKIRKLPESVVFQTELEANGKWPSKIEGAKRPQFKGYRFEPSTRRPIFIYEVDGVTIEDHPVPTMADDDEPILNRRFHFKTSGPKQIYFRTVSKNNSVVTTDGKWTLIGLDGFDCKLSSTAKMEVDSETNSEVVVKIDLSGGEAILEQVYEW